jgi:hypothetical protein
VLDRPELFRPPGTVAFREQPGAEIPLVVLGRPALVVFDAKIHDDVEPEQIQERVLNDGSSHHVFKRYFTASQLSDELGDGRVLFEGRWFVMVESSAGRVR